MEEEQWQWQEPGTAWRGICIYHFTLTVPSRQPLLGTLVIPNNDPSQARVERTALGNAVVDELYVMCRHYPAIRILQFCLMPDHLHAVIRVTKVMDTSIRSVLRGYWQGVKKLGRAYTLSVSPSPAASSLVPPSSPSLSVPPEFNSGATSQGSNDWAFPVFTERPFIRPLSRRGQLEAMMHYVRLNPQRLATKRLMPGFFRVQKAINIAGHSFDAVGNVALLHALHYDVVHVRSLWVKAAEHGDNQTLRDYYKPSAALFDACAAGKVLILSPWPYDATKRHISRADCVSLNNLAEAFCQAMDSTKE